MHRKRVYIVFWSIVLLVIGICVFFYFHTGYAFYVENVKPLDLYDESGEIKEEYNHEFYRELSQSDIVYFIGDSITCGSANGERPWYEPIAKAITPECRQIAHGGFTSWDMVQVLYDIDFPGDGDSVLFVINLGVNDVFRNDRNTCANTEEEYIENMMAIVSRIREIYPESRFVFIASWREFYEELNFDISLEEQERILSGFDVALQSYCQKEGFVYIDPNPYIREHVDSKPKWYYLLDGLHPNSRYGTTLYSEAVMRYDIE